MSADDRAPLTTEERQALIEQCFAVDCPTCEAPAYFACDTPSLKGIHASRIVVALRGLS